MYRAPFSVVLCLAAATLSVSPARGATPGSPQAGGPSRPRNRRMIRGGVLSVDAKARKIFVRLDGIPGYMTPMNMSYDVGPREDLRALSPGDRVEADVEGNGRNTYVENIRVIARAGDAARDKPR